MLKRYWFRLESIWHSSIFECITFFHNIYIFDLMQIYLHIIICKLCIIYYIILLYLSDISDIHGHTESKIRDWTWTHRSVIDLSPVLPRPTPPASTLYPTSDAGGTSRHTGGSPGAWWTQLLSVVGGRHVKASHCIYFYGLPFDRSPPVVRLPGVSGGPEICLVPGNSGLCF